MAELVSSLSNLEKMPQSFVFPPGKRPELHVPTCKTIPVIDLAKMEGHDRTNIVQQMMKAGQEFGFFQVINHGVDRKLMDDARRVFKGFFNLPDEYKLKFCSEDYNKKCVLYPSNVFYHNEERHYWRDALKHCCTPLEECIQHWPEKPTGYREVAVEYTLRVQEMGSRILDLLSQGLGLEQGYFANGLSQVPALTVNHYPSCPDPSLTFGVANHCDPNIITILLQDLMGLQVFKDGEWIGVEPILDAFVINLGYAMQIVSNGKLKAVEHRAVTNATEARTTVAFFIIPANDCFVEPAKSLINKTNPPQYKGVRYEEFMQTFQLAHCGVIDHALDPYVIKA